jgi:hypothetical protein
MRNYLTVKEMDAYLNTLRRALHRAVETRDASFENWQTTARSRTTAHADC